MKLLSAFILALAVPAAALAQSYPTRAVTLIVPFPPGGPTDTSARVIAKALGARLGQPMVVENRPGAGGALGAGIAAKAAPDGYTLFWGSASTLAVAPAVMPNINYDAVKSFEHVSLVARSPHLLVGRPNIGAANVKELVALAKAKPNALSYGSAGNGSATHLTGELFKSVLGVELLHVPYKGGGPALNDLLGGQIHMVFDAIPTLVPHIQAGKLVAYALTGKERMSVLPGVPTVSEALGVDFEAYSFFGLVAPAGTPPAVTARLAQELRPVLADEEVRKPLVSTGFEVVGTTPEQFRAFVAEEVKKWSAVAKAKGIQLN